jgi:hypothetical protein
MNAGGPGMGRWHSRITVSTLFFTIGKREKAMKAGVESIWKRVFFLS